MSCEDGQFHIFEDAIGIAIALRDFFYCANSQMLAEAVSAFSCIEPLTNEQVQKLEYEFNKFFVGPTAPIAPPYASVYLENESRLMGESTLQIRCLYSALGLKAPDIGVPDDFIAYELEAWLVLYDLLIKNDDQNARKSLQWLNNHIASWLPQFITRITTAEVSDCLRYVVLLLRKWLSISSLALSEAVTCKRGKE